MSRRTVTVTIKVEKEAPDGRTAQALIEMDYEIVRLSNVDQIGLAVDKAEREVDDLIRSSTS